MDTFKNETFQAGPCDILQQKELIYLYVEFVIYFMWSHLQLLQLFLSL